MSSNSGRRRKPKPIQPAKAPGPAQSTGPSSTKRESGPCGTTLWLLRIGLLVFTPLVALLLAEGALRLSGFGYPTSFFVQSGSEGGYVTNEKFGWQFFSKKTPLKPFLFTLPARKPAGTLRVCILGESVAMGTPDPAFAFGRILEGILRRRHPEVHVEVMNAAMRGIDIIALCTRVKNHE